MKKLALIFLLIFPLFTFASIAKVGTDTSSTGNALSLSFSHTLVAGENRLVAVYIGLENGDTVNITGVTYGGNAMTRAVSASTTPSGFRDVSEVWYILEANLPANGSQTVAITGSGTASSPEINALAAEYTGVKQQGPEATDADAQTSGATITSTISPSSGAWVLSSLSAGNTGSFTHSDSQAELIDFNDASSVFSAAELRGGSGQTSVSSTYTGTVNRLTRAAASFEQHVSYPQVKVNNGRIVVNNGILSVD